MSIQATPLEGNAFLAEFIPALSNLAQTQVGGDVSDKEEEMEKLKAINSFLDMKVRELKKEQDRPLKSKILAYGSTLFFSAAIGAYQVVVDAGSNSEDKNFRLVSVMMLVALSWATLGCWQFFADQSDERQKDNLNLRENKIYRQFTGAVLAYAKNPNETLRKNMIELYHKLPQFAQELLKKPMSTLDSSLLIENMIADRSVAKREIAVDVDADEKV